MALTVWWDESWTRLTFFGTVFAALFVATTLYYFAKNFFVFFLAEPLGLTVNFREIGKWAVVTGSTDGIGKGYAFDLARRGCNIVLISRTQEKLRRVAQEIETKYNVRTKIIVADFTSGKEIYPAIKEQLAELEIGTLVNNVGMLPEYPDFFEKIPGGEDIYVNMINCNITSQTMMTRIVAPQMIARKKGVIISLSSAAGSTPLPLMAVYSATKAYNRFLSASLEQEYRGQGVIVQSIDPLVVSTNMSMNVKANLFVIDATKYARSCLNTVGFLSHSSGHPSHALQNWFLIRVPAFFMSRSTLPVMLWARNQTMERLKAKKP